MSARNLAVGGLLAAFSLIIPLYFGFLRVYLPPFSATLASHVPVMLAIFVNPLTALLVGAASTLGFFITLGPVIAARAAVHMLFGVTGALLYRKGMPAWQVLLATLPIHALGESLAVVPFGYDLFSAGIVVGVGTVLHHGVDSLFTLAALPVMLRLGLGNRPGNAVEKLAG